MRGFIAIVKHEIWARRVLITVALVIGLLAPIIPYFADDQTVVASQVQLTLVFGGLLATALTGFALLGGELQGWMRFYFSRPLATWQIVAGKLCGAVIVMLAVQIVLTAPPRLIMHNILPNTRAGALGTGFGHYFYNLLWLQIVSLGLLLGGAATGVMARSRSFRILGDSVLQVILVLEVVLIAHRFDTVVRWPRDPTEANVKHFHVLQDRADMIWDVLLVALIVTFIAAIVGAIGRGRIDPLRAHGALSRTLWGLAIPAAALGLLYVQFFFA